MPTSLALHPGDTVDVVMPGFRAPEENVKLGMAYIKKLKLVPRAPEDLVGEDLLCANSDERRFEHLKAALYSDSKAVWCVRAGYGAIRLIDRLRKLRPPRKRKLFIGYSDVTTIHHFLNHEWNWPTVHGPVLDRLGTGGFGDVEREELRDLLFGKAKEIRFSGLTPLNESARKKGIVRGKVFGGNLTVLQTTLGTPLQNNRSGMLFLEDIGERGYRIDRMLQHFAQAGALRRVKAIVLGSFVGGAETGGGDLVRPVLERFAKEQKAPVFIGMKAGHGDIQRPVCFNTEAVLRCGPEGDLRIGGFSSSS